MPLFIITSSPATLRSSRPKGHCPRDLEYRNVVFADGQTRAVEIAEQSCHAFCRQKLAGFKVPTLFLFSELQKTATGKIQKFVLRELVRTAANGTS
jgi:acyl-CoA synthetase (AMP-forming)/AMP-acid ligase II